MINKICIVCGQPILVERESVRNYDGSQPQHIKCYQKTTTQPDHSKSSNLKKDIEDALDWQLRATIEAMFEAEKTGKPIKVHVTQELIDKHKSKATTQIIDLIESVIPEEKKTDIEIPDTLHRNIGYNQAIKDIKSKLIGGE